MLQKVKTNKGFTIIELMIVLAIIGVLAAIAIPQFMSYRMKAYHTSTVSDVRNWVAAEAALFMDGAAYGISVVGDSLNAPPSTGLSADAGDLIVGGRSAGESVAATATEEGVMLSGSRSDRSGAALDFSFPVAVGDGVKLVAAVSVNAAAPLYNDSYVIQAEHIKGINAYAADSDRTNTVFFCQNEEWPENDAASSELQANILVPLAGEDDTTGVGAPGGKVINWEIVK